MLLDLWPALTPAPAPPTHAGGTPRRHQGQSSGVQKQIHRTIRFRWQFTASVTGELGPPPRSIRFHWNHDVATACCLTSVERFPGAPLRLTGHTSARIDATHPFRVETAGHLRTCSRLEPSPIAIRIELQTLGLLDSDEDELLALLLLDIL